MILVKERENIKMVVVERQFYFYFKRRNDGNVKVLQEEGGVFIVMVFLRIILVYVRVGGRRILLERVLSC